MMVKSKSRIEYIDFIKFIAIYLVIWGHAIVYGMSGSDPMTDFHPAYNFIYSFHMPLFMIVSGFFAKSVLSVGFLTFVSKKIRQLIVPAILWTTIRIIILGMVMHYSFKFNDVLSNYMYDYWFLKCLFLCYVIFWISIKVCKSDVYAAIASVVLASLIPSANFLYVNAMLVFFWIGHFVHTKDISGLKYVWGILIVYISLMFFWKSEYTIYELPIHFVYWDIPPRFDVSNFLLSSMRMILGLSGSFVAIILLKKVYGWLNLRSKNLASWGNTIGRMTLGIYLVQQIMIVVVTKVIVFDANVNITLFDFGLSHIIAIITLVLSTGIVYMLSNMKIGRILVGMK